MSDQGFPVTVAVRRPDGRTEQVRVGTAVRNGEGFSLRLGELSIGSTPDAAPAPRRAASSSYGGGGGGGGGEISVFPNYGRSKGGPIQGASMGDLEYYANGARRSLGDPSKSRWHDRERQLLAAIEAEIARQRGGDFGGGDNEPPPHGDDDFNRGGGGNDDDNIPF
ncbi:hypothetical protein [Melittangium boletus]|uniref:Uncharacterized protein n=1 Tax=Melittangium boletus DSM 14713 TaxID=1294270 RepID=A0A250IE83_9BACT|nr:hypothetical protein [Melittangium boletus]ATB29548.1 hypothetical protein MEBOL_003003 [Melittangium boletus DSM 14713]